MCYYITAVLPRETSQPVAQAVAERHARNLTPLANPGIQDQLRAGEQYCLTTAGHCDCDTSLGLVVRKRPTHQSQTEVKERKFAALGWSKAKIERALSQSAQSHARSAVRAQQSAAADAETWLAFITAVHAAGIPYIGLLLHFYDGALSENLLIKARVMVRSGAQAHDLLPRLAEDTLYEFRAEA
jgi:hypothetical protein